jgi:hypothetical protein
MGFPPRKISLELKNTHHRLHDNYKGEILAQRLHALEAKLAVEWPK